MTVSAIDWDALLEPVALDLLGEPNWKRTSGSDWRYGTKGSLSVRIDRGVWFDHEEGRGGGVLKLVMRETRCDERGAIDWLRNRGHLRHDETRFPCRLHRPAGKPVRSPSSSRSSPKRTEDSGFDSIVEPLWSASIPADATPGSTYLAHRCAWPPSGYAFQAALPEDVRWLAREFAPGRDPGAKWMGVPPGLAGALLFGLRCPESSELRAVALEGLDAQGRRARERWRRTYGRARGAVFEAKAGGRGGTVHVAEGFVDALALVWAPWLEPRAGRIVAIGGTPGLRSLRARDVPTLFGSASAVVIHTDGDGAGMAAGVRAQAHIQAAGRTCRIRRCTPGIDPADEVAQWLQERAAILEFDSGQDRKAAVRSAWRNAIQSSRRQ